MPGDRPISTAISTACIGVIHRPHALIQAFGVIVKGVRRLLVQPKTDRSVQWPYIKLCREFGVQVGSAIAPISIGRDRAAESGQDLHAIIRLANCARPDVRARRR
jgi:hypothetical protein